MIEEMGGIVEKMLFLIELDFLNPREKLSGYKIDSLIHC
jgi:adenine/guanine phosphoribosyltransferase-like PRPP-binding protein